MSAPRFYCPVALAAHQTIVLPEAVAHHAVRVLRLRDGDAITLFNGQGGETPAVLRVQGKSVAALLAQHEPREAELTVRITLAQGLPASNKMDGIVEKAVELGVHTLVPVIAQRSAPQGAGRLEKRLEHWQRIVAAASAQCGRNRLMAIAAPIPFTASLPAHGSSTDAVHLLCHPQGSQTLSQALAHTPRAVTLYVGPEGGWSETELQQAHSAGVTLIRFGARVLRTETAGIALAAAVQVLLDAA